MSLDRWAVPGKPGILKRKFVSWFGKAGWLGLVFRPGQRSRSGSAAGTLTSTGKEGGDGEGWLKNQHVHGNSSTEFQFTWVS